MADHDWRPGGQGAKCLDDLIKVWRADAEQEHVDREGAKPDALTVAILSDVHGVTMALDAVLRSAYANGAGQVWCLGDVIGRGPSPEECIERLASLGPILLPVWLMGNHEAMWLDETCDASMRASPDARRVIADHRRQLETVLVRRTLPPRFRTVWEWSTDACSAPVRNGPTIFAVHGGAPTADCSPFEVYVDRTPEVDSLLSFGKARASALAVAPPKILLAGHTHVPAAWEWNRGNPQPRQIPVRFGEQTPVSGECTYINVGSSGGFTHGGSSNPTYALLRIGGDEVVWSLIEVKASLEPEILKMGKLNYPTQFIEDLERRDDRAEPGVVL